MRRAALVMLALALAPALASAQESAREALVDGTASAQQERWSDALAHFRRAYALSRNPVALYDVATTLRVLGRYVEARDAALALLRDHEPLAADLRAGALALRADVEPRIARLVLALPDLPSLMLRVDGERRAGETLELDPGEHTVLASAPRHHPFQAAVTLAPGETRELAITLAPAPDDATFDDWLIGLSVGAGALLLIAGAVGGGFAAQAGAQLTPRTDVVLEP